MYGANEFPSGKGFRYNAYGNGGRAAAGYRGGGSGVQGIQRGKPVRPLSSVVYHGDGRMPQHDAFHPFHGPNGGLSPSVQQSPHAVSTLSTIRCCDPYNQKVYEVPSMFVEDTLGMPFAAFLLLSSAKHTSHPDMQASTRTRQTPLGDERKCA